MHGISFVAHEHRRSIGCIAAAGEHTYATGSRANPYASGDARTNYELAGITFTVWHGRGDGSVLVPERVVVLQLHRLPARTALNDAGRGARRQRSQQGAY